jgi:hypothetical protein
MLDMEGYRELAKDVLDETGELLAVVEVTPEHYTCRLSFGKDDGE